MAETKEQFPKLEIDHRGARCREVCAMLIQAFSIAWEKRDQIYEWLYRLWDDAEKHGYAQGKQDALKRAAEIAREYVTNMAHHKE